MPETGILDMSLIYILDQLSIENEADANITNAVFIISGSVGLIIGPLVILPWLQKRACSNIQILCVGGSLFLVSFVLLSLLQWIKSMVIPVIGGCLLTCGFIAFPAANGTVTKHLTKNEQGIGFGVIFAVRSLTWILAPVSFAEMYSFFKEKGVPSMTMYSAAFMIMFAMIIIVWPLRMTVMETERLQKKYSFGTVELQMMDNENDKNSKKEVMTTNDIKKTEMEMNTAGHFETLDGQIR